MPKTYNEQIKNSEQIYNLLEEMMINDINYYL